MLPSLGAGLHPKHKWCKSGPTYWKASLPLSELGGKEEKKKGGVSKRYKAIFLPTYFLTSQLCRPAFQGALKLSDFRNLEVHWPWLQCQLRLLLPRIWKAWGSPFEGQPWSYFAALAQTCVHTAAVSRKKALRLAPEQSTVENGTVSVMRFQVRCVRFGLIYDF